MSMICCFRALSDEAIEKLLNNPSLVRAYLYGPEAPKPEGLWARLFGRKQASSGAESVLDQDIHFDFDIDKTWHGIHFLLTGTDWEGEEPFNFLHHGGIEVGKVDVGYGPARVFRSSEVKKLADALDQISSDELRGRYNPERMTELSIYPMIWDRDPSEDDVLGYLLTYYEDLKAFIAMAGEKQFGLLIYLN